MSSEHRLFGQLSQRKHRPDMGVVVTQVVQGPLDPPDVSKSKMKKLKKKAAAERNKADAVTEGDGSTTGCFVEVVG